MDTQVKKLKDQSDYWNNLTTEEKTRIEVGINDLDAGRKTPYEAIIASHRRK